MSSTPREIGTLVVVILKAVRPDYLASYSEHSQVEPYTHDLLLELLGTYIATSTQQTTHREAGSVLLRDAEWREETNTRD